MIVKLEDTGCTHDLVVESVEADRVHTIRGIPALLSTASANSVATCDVIAARVYSREGSLYH